MSETKTIGEDVSLSWNGVAANRHVSQESIVNGSVSYTTETSKSVVTNTPDLTPGATPPPASETLKFSAGEKDLQLTAKLKGVITDTVYTASDATQKVLVSTTTVDDKGISVRKDTENITDRHQVWKSVEQQVAPVDVTPTADPAAPISDSTTPIVDTPPATPVVSDSVENSIPPESNERHAIGMQTTTTFKPETATVSAEGLSYAKTTKMESNVFRDKSTIVSGEGASAVLADTQSIVEATLQTTYITEGRSCGIFVDTLTTTIETVKPIEPSLPSTEGVASTDAAAKTTETASTPSGASRGISSVAGGLTNIAIKATSNLVNRRVYGLEIADRDKVDKYDAMNVAASGLDGFVAGSMAELAYASSRVESGTTGGLIAAGAVLVAATVSVVTNEKKRHMRKERDAKFKDLSSKVGENGELVAEDEEPIPSTLETVGTTLLDVAPAVLQVAAATTQFATQATSIGTVTAIGIETMRSVYHYRNETKNSDGTLVADGMKVTENVTASIVAAGVSIGVGTAMTVAMEGSALALAAQTSLMASAVLISSTAIVTAIAVTAATTIICKLFGWWRRRALNNKLRAELRELYIALKLPDTAGYEEIRKAYKKMSLKNHPDRGGDMAVFQLKSEQFDRLLELVKMDGVVKKTSDAEAKLYFALH
eukprot:gene39733-49103_t